MFEVYLSCSSDGAVASMRSPTAARISVAHSPTDSSTTRRFDARGTDRDLPSTTAPSSRGHRPSRSPALTCAFGRGKSRYVHDSNVPLRVTAVPQGRDEEADPDLVSRGEIERVAPDRVSLARHARLRALTTRLRRSRVTEIM